MNFLDLTPQFAALRATMHDMSTNDKLGDQDIDQGLVKSKKKGLVDYDAASGEKPTWLKNAEIIQKSLDYTRDAIEKLKLAQSRHLQNIVDDSLGGLVEGKRKEVRALVQQDQVLLKKFEKSIPEAETSIQRRVYNGLSSQFSDVLSSFRTMQVQYAQTIRKQSISYESTSQDASEAKDAMNQVKEVLMKRNAEMAKKTYEEIKQIAQSVLEILEIAGDMRMFIERQGEMIDRVDMNVTMALENVREGVEELNEADKEHKKFAKKEIAGFVVLAVGVLALTITIVSIFS